MVSIGKWLLYGIIGAFAISALVRPEQAYATTQAFSGVGSALGSLGGGIQSLLSGTGTGVAKLFNPLFTLRDLIYPAQAGVQTSLDVAELSRLGGIQSEPQYIANTTTIERQPGTPSTTSPTIPLPSPAPLPSPTGTQYNQGFTFASTPAISPVPTAPTRVHGQDVPLSQTAIDYYNKIGVDVSPSSNQTVSSTNSQNATSAAHNTGSYVGALGVASWLR
jgi:hypothetical protein